MFGKVLILFLLCFMMTQILFWNIQGAASKGFRRSFSTLLKNYFPSVVIMMDPRISGQQVDDFIKSTGFDNSHRIEASLDSLAKLF